METAWSLMKVKGVGWRGGGVVGGGGGQFVCKGDGSRGLEIMSIKHAALH